MIGNSSFLQSDEEFAHRSCKSVFKPAARQGDAGLAFRKKEVDVGLVIQARSTAAQGASLANDGSHVLGTVLSVGIEAKAYLRILVSNPGGSECWRSEGLLRKLGGHGAQGLW